MKATSTTAAHKKQLTDKQKVEAFAAENDIQIESGIIAGVIRLTLTDHSSRFNSTGSPKSIEFNYPDGKKEQGWKSARLALVGGIDHPATVKIISTAIEAEKLNEEFNERRLARFSSQAKPATPIVTDEERQAIKDRKRAAATKPAEKPVAKATPAPKPAASTDPKAEPVKRVSTIPTYDATNLPAEFQTTDLPKGVQISYGARRDYPQFGIKVGQPYYYWTGFDGKIDASLWIPPKSRLARTLWTRALYLIEEKISDATFAVNSRGKGTDIEAMIREASNQIGLMIALRTDPTAKATSKPTDETLKAWKTVLDTLLAKFEELDHAEVEAILKGVASHDQIVLTPATTTEAN